MADKKQMMMSPLLKLSNKIGTVLMVVLLPPPLMPVSEVCHWALSTGSNLASAAALNLRPILESRHRRLSLTPSEATVARVLPTAMLWCGVAGMVAAALALLLGASRRRARLALAYAALAAAAANHCLCARLFALLLVPDEGSTSWDCLLLSIFATVGIVFFATRDLAGFQSLRKAAAAADQEAAGSKAQ